MHLEPLNAHAWLLRLIGTWDIEGECSAGPGEPAFKTRSTERVRMLGGPWIVAEGEGEMPGGERATTMMTLGWNAQRQRFAGTWIGSMMGHLWVYDGTLDAAGQVLTLETEGPDFGAEGRTARYQDIITFHSDDHRTLTSRMLGEDGTWREIVTAHYRRQR